MFLLCSLCFCLESCASNEFGCHDVILVCMDERVACDGPPHCADESDEMQCGKNTSFLPFFLYSYYQIWTGYILTGILAFDNQ